MEKLGAEQLSLIMNAVGEAINVLHRIAKDKKSIFEAFALTDELSALGSVSGEQLKLQLLDLSQEERAQLIEQFKGKLVLSDKVLEAKLESGAVVLDECIDVVYEAVSVIQHGLACKVKAEKLFSEPVVQPL